MESEIEYTHEVKRSVALDRELSQKDAEFFVASVHFTHISNHGTLNIRDINGKPFSRDAILKRGDVFKTNQPQLEGDEYTEYQVVECDTKSNDRKYIRIRTLKSSSKSALKETEFWIIYNNADPEHENKPTVTYHIKCIPNHNSVVKLMEMTYDVTLKRVKRYSEDPENVIRELELISGLDFQYLDDSPVDDHEFAVETNIKIPAEMKLVSSRVNRYGCLTKLFSTLVQEKGISLDTPLASIRNFKLIMNNISIGLKGLSKTENQLAFSIEQTEDGYSFQSIDDVAHFRSIIYSIKFQELDGATATKITLHFDTSTMVGLGRGLKSFSSFFTDSVPDPKLIMQVRARAMLDTFIRHFVEYLRTDSMILVCDVGQDIALANRSLEKK